MKFTPNGIIPLLAETHLKCGVLSKGGGVHRVIIRFKYKRRVKLTCRE